MSPPKVRVIPPGVSGDELGKLTPATRHVSCSLCGARGHNKSTCKDRKTLGAAGPKKSQPAPKRPQQPIAARAEAPAAKAPAAMLEQLAQKSEADAAVLRRAAEIIGK